MAQNKQNVSVIEAEMSRFEEEISSIQQIPGTSSKSMFLPPQLRSQMPANKATPANAKAPAPIISSAPVLYNKWKPVEEEEPKPPAVPVVIAPAVLAAPALAPVVPKTEGKKSDAVPMEIDSLRKSKHKKKKFVRCAGGVVWEDTSLTDWDADDFRLFCGDLGNEVTDEVLARAFNRYSTFLKAKVVRDKRTGKSKGFGFVSFKDPNDFMRAMREMNGKYVGNRPIKLRKSTWRERDLHVVKKKAKEKTKQGLR